MVIDLCPLWRRKTISLDSLWILLIIRLLFSIIQLLKWMTLQQWFWTLSWYLRPVLKSLLLFFLKVYLLDIGKLLLGLFEIVNHFLNSFAFVHGLSTGIWNMAISISLSRHVIALSYSVFIRFIWWKHSTFLNHSTLLNEIFHRLMLLRQRWCLQVIPWCCILLHFIDLVQVISLFEILLQLFECHIL